MKERYIWIDILNITACLGVVLLHSTNGQVHSFSGDFSTDWGIGILTHSFFLWPVDIFFMISGFTLINQKLITTDTENSGIKHFYKRRLSRLAIPILVWDIIYMLKYILQCHHNNLEIGGTVDLIKKFILLEYNSYMWFFLPLIVIYISLPFFAIFILNAEKFIIRLFLIIGLILGLFSFSDSSSANAYLMGTRYLYFTGLGYYLGNTDFNKRERYKIYSAAIISMILILIGTVILFKYTPERHGYFLSYTNIPCVLSAIGIFTFFKYTNWNVFLCKHKISRQTIIEISSLSLGIYLIQYLWFSLFAHFYPIDNIILRFFVIYTVSLISVFIMKKIPLLKRIIS